MKTKKLFLKYYPIALIWMFVIAFNVWIYLLVNDCFSVMLSAGTMGVIALGFTLITLVDNNKPKPKNFLYNEIFPEPPPRATALPKPTRYVYDEKSGFIVDKKINLCVCFLFPQIRSQELGNRIANLLNESES